LPADEGVQLIVFFAPIREILRKGIYGGDKECFWTMKTKGIFSALRTPPWQRQMRSIRFMNNRQQRIFDFPAVVFVP
jgi:hypothetical protein